MSKGSFGKSTRADSGDSAMQTKHKRACNTLSADSEGPLIIIDDANTGSESESSGSPSTDELRSSKIIPTSGCDSVQSSGTEMTSEGADSEAERRPLTPSSAATLTEFLDKAFSDEGLSKDLFLLKHVRRHRHGFVSLKLLAGFKESKKLHGDWHSLSLAAKQSSFLEVSSDGSKVRRKNSLPEELLHVPSSRFLAVVNLMEDLMTVDKLASAFGRYGPIVSLHLIKHKPGGGIPQELQALAARVPEVAHTNCALVQFEDVWGVSRAIKEFSNSKTTLHVFYNKKRPSRPSPVMKPSTPHHIRPYNTQHANKRRDSYETEWRKRIFYNNRRESTGSEAEEFDARIRNLRLETRQPRKSLPNINPVRKPSSDPLPNSLPNSPQMKRKFVTKGIDRDPKGPDGTQGFHRK